MMNRDYISGIVAKNVPTSYLCILSACAYIAKQPPTRKTEILKPSKRKLSNAAPSAFHQRKYWPVMAGLSLLFLLFSYSI